MRRLLAVLPDHPYPLDMGNRVRNLRILEALAKEFELGVVSLVPDRRLLLEPGPVAALGRWYPVLAPHRVDAWGYLRWHVAARWERLLSGTHPETYFQSLPVMARTVSAIVAEWKPDLVHVAYWYTLRRLEHRPRPPLWVVDTHDVQQERHARVFGAASDREAREEIAALRRFDHVIAITEDDAATFRRLLGAEPPIEVVPMGIDLVAWDPRHVEPALPPAARVGFYGNLSTPANQAAARELRAAILPAVSTVAGPPEFLILGASPPADILGWATDGSALVPGFVEDIRPWLRSLSVLLLPLRAASGQRGRVLEALALEVPVIAYDEAVAGLVLTGGGVLRVAGPGEMAAAATRMLAASEERLRRGREGRAEVEATYGWEATYGRFPRLYREWIERGEQNASGPDASTDRADPRTSRGPKA